MRNVIQYIRRAFGERSDDPFPLEWIVVACLLSAGTFWWGWRLGGTGFFQNVLASLALLGPGLVLTNVVARNWRIKKAKSNRETVLDRFMRDFDWIFKFHIEVLRKVQFKDQAEAFPVGVENWSSWNRVDRWMFFLMSYSVASAYVHSMPDSAGLSETAGEVRFKVQAIGGANFDSRRRSAIIARLRRDGNFPTVELRANEVFEEAERPIRCWTRDIRSEVSLSDWQSALGFLTIYVDPARSHLEADGWKSGQKIADLVMAREFSVHIMDLAAWLSATGAAMHDLYYEIIGELGGAFDPTDGIW